MKLTNRTDECIALRIIALQEHDRQMNEYFDQLLDQLHDQSIDQHSDQVVDQPIDQQ